VTNVTPRCQILDERREGAITDTLRIARPGRNNSPRTTARASADATPGIKPTNGPEVITSVQKDVETRTTADEKIAAGIATFKVDARAVAATRGVDVTAVAVTDAEKDVDTTAAAQKVNYNHGREEQQVDRPEGHHDDRQRDGVHWTGQKAAQLCSLLGTRNHPSPRRGSRTRANVDLFFGEDEAEEAHDHEQKAETLS